MLHSKEKISIKKASKEFDVPYTTDSITNTAQKRVGPLL